MIWPVCQVIGTRHAPEPGLAPFVLVVPVMIRSIVVSALPSRIAESVTVKGGLICVNIEDAESLHLVSGLFDEIVHCADEVVQSLAQASVQQVVGPEDIPSKLVTNIVD